MNWKKLAAASLILPSLMGVGDFMIDKKVSAEVIQIENILSVTGIAEVYGDGEKISCAILEYPKKINSKSVSVKSFEVEGKIIKSAKADKNTVILKFENVNTAFDGALNFNPKRPKNESAHSGDAPMRSDRKLPNLNFTVKQIDTISAVDGTEFLPSEKAVTKISAPAIEKFRQFTYTDKNGNSMPYNLYLPENYDANKKYPLLFFVADASANINEVTTPLFQGNGATSFLDKNCIILAPQYTSDLVEKIGMMTTDENIWTDGLDLVTELLFDVIENYSVDKNRIYGTGQSQGGMTNIAISDKYPELFAAQLLVACQWNVDEMEVLKDKNLWIVVCEGDEKAFPGMNDAVARWEKLGAKVARNENFWNSKASISELNKQVKNIEQQRANINYTVFAGGNHMYTWSFTYNIDALRDWLFKQKK